MAHSNQAKKRIRQNITRYDRNVSAKSAIKTSIKKFEAALTSGEAGQVQSALLEAVSLIDKAGRKRILHPNTASRKKSSLMKKAGAAVSSSS